MPDNPTAAAAAMALDITQYETASKGFDVNTTTLVVASKNLLERGIQTDEDYQSALELAEQAAKQEKKHTDNFDAICKLLNAAHKGATKLRAQYSAPWLSLKDALRGAAREWYLAMQRAKQAQERELAERSREQQRALEAQAQELMDAGLVRQAREKVMSAQTLSAPVLPSAVPPVASARVTPKYKATCNDLGAVIAAVANGRFDLMWEVRGEMRPLITVDQTVLNAIVSRLGKSLKCPGITVEDDVQFGSKKL